MTDQINSQYQRENSNNQVIHSEEALGDSGEEEVLFNRKRTIIEAGSGRGTIGGGVREAEKKHKLNSQHPEPIAAGLRVT